MGIKFKNGFNVDVPYDILHTNPVRFSRITFAQEILNQIGISILNRIKISGDPMQRIFILRDG